MVASLSRRDGLALALALALGDQIMLHGRCEQVHVFERASGLRMD